jgi:hypothetical protein
VEEHELKHLKISCSRKYMNQWGIEGYSNWAH